MAFNYKSITDPLYGYVGLSEVEAAIVSSSVFQRLHNVRQLGLAHLVFPSAGYSRFAHSIGACHNAGRIIDAINANSTNKIGDKKKQIYRLAALLHDIGHYPFSHATEHAIESYYVGKSILDFGSGTVSEGQTEVKGLHHEKVGEIIINNDPEIQLALKKHKIDSDTLSKVFSKSDPDSLFGIISSDLDCDRLDYLKRSAHSCGVPYGEVDTDFIISKATVDKDNILCFQSKAASAIDHFLISRFYDYMQVVFHKTVVALEWSLEESIIKLLDRNALSINSNDVLEMVQKQQWAEFDDNFLFGKFKELSKSLLSASGESVGCNHLNAVLFRKPAKLVYQWDEILPKESDTPLLRSKLIETKVAQVAQEMDLDAKRFSVIVRKPFPFSSDFSKSSDQLTYGEQARSVSILDKGKRKSTLLSERKDCLVANMVGDRKFSINVFYLPMDGEEKSVRDSIRDVMASE